jgi:hypothetical protein
LVAIKSQRYQPTLFTYCGRALLLDRENLSNCQGSYNAFAIRCHQCIERTPTCSMPGGDQPKSKDTDIPHRLGDDLLIATRQVETANNRMERD